MMNGVKKGILVFKKSKAVFKNSIFKNRLFLIITSSLLLLVCIGVLVMHFSKRMVDSIDMETPIDQPEISVSLSLTPTPTVIEPTPTPIKIISSSWPVELTLEEAGSITVVVNKKHRLPADYVPNGGNLLSVTQSALEDLISAATNNGHNIYLLSGYRSYSNQQSTYNYWVNLYGQAYADTISARAGHSEHQTGLAVDVGSGTCDLETCFGDTAAGRWIADNASSYGFIIRYPDGKEAITGYQYEPWHLRYVGTPLAQEIADSGLTLDEYFGVPAGVY